MSIGFTFPFTAATGSIGLFETSENEFDALRNDIHSLLITNWGERVMHYNLGCNLREFLFEPKTSPELREAIADRIISQFNMWLPFLNVVQLNILFTEDRPDIPENGLGVFIAYELESKPDLDPVKATFLIL